MDGRLHYNIDTEHNHQRSAFTYSHLAEYDAVEGAVEADLHLHVLLAAHHLEIDDLGHVRRPLRLPQVGAGHAVGPGIVPLR